MKKPLKVKVVNRKTKKVDKAKTSDMNFDNKTADNLAKGRRKLTKNKHFKDEKDPKGEILKAVKSTKADRAKGKKKSDHWDSISNAADHIAFPKKAREAAKKKK